MHTLLIHILLIAAHFGLNSDAYVVDIYKVGCYQVQPNPWPRKGTRGLRVDRKTSQTRTGAGSQDDSQFLDDNQVRPSGDK